MKKYGDQQLDIKPLIFLPTTELAKDINMDDFDELGVLDLEDVYSRQDPLEAEEQEASEERKTELQQWSQQTWLVYMFLQVERYFWYLLNGLKFHNRFVIVPPLICEFVATGAARMLIEDAIRFGADRATVLILKFNKIDFTDFDTRFQFKRLIEMLGNSSALRKIILNGNDIVGVDLALGLLSYCNISKLETVIAPDTVINETLLLRLEERLREQILFVNVWSLASDHTEVILLSMRVAAEMNHLHDFTFYIGRKIPMDVDWSSDLWYQLAENKNRFTKLVLDYGANESTVRASYISAISNNRSADTVYYQRWAYSKKPTYINLAASVFNALIDFNNTITKVYIAGRDMNDALVTLLCDLIARSQSIISIRIHYEPGYGPMPQKQSKEIMNSVSGNFKLLDFEADCLDWRHLETIEKYITLNKLGRSSDPKDLIEVMTKIDELSLFDTDKQSLRFLLLNSCNGLLFNNLS